MQTCILVLGMHRSGTSALSGTLSMLDVYLGSQLMRPLDQNPKGFYENMLLHKINEDLLRGMNSSWDDVFYNEKKFHSVKHVSELEQVLKEEFQYSKLFAIKDPRLVYLFPLYVQALSNLGVEIKIIIPFRNPLEVARSLRARDGFSQEKGLLLWAYNFLLSEKISRGFSRVFTRFDELVQSPKKVIELIDKKLELNIGSKYESKKYLLQEFLTPDLKHHNVSLDNLSENVPGIIREIVNQVPHLNDVDSTEKLDSLRNQLFDNQALFYNADILSALDRLAQAEQGLQAKDQELAQAEQGLQAKDQELAQAEQGLQAKDQELAQAEQGLQAKDQELAQAKQGLQAKESELSQAIQSLVDKDAELHFVRHGLQDEKSRLTDTQQDLQKKESELNYAIQLLQDKEDQIAQCQQHVKVGVQELSSLRQELLGVYKSRSWRITRFLRNVKSKLNK